MHATYATVQNVTYSYDQMLFKNNTRTKRLIDGSYSVWFKFIRGVTLYIIQDLIMAPRSGNRLSVISYMFYNIVLY